MVHCTIWKVLSHRIQMFNMKAPSLLNRKLWPRLKFIKSRSTFKVKVTRSKIMVPCERSCHKKNTCAIWKPYLFWIESYGQGQTSRSRSQGQNYGTMWKVLSQGIHVCNIKALSLLVRKLRPRFKFFKVGQTSKSRSRGQKLWFHVKGLVTRNTHVKYESCISQGMKAMAKVEVLESRSNLKVKVTMSKLMVPCESSCDKEYICAIWKPHLSRYERYGQG